MKNTKEKINTSLIQGKETLYKKLKKFIFNLFNIKLFANSNLKEKQAKREYKILILSNPDNNEFYEEDTYIANSFKEDGHDVKMLWIDYDEKLDDDIDIVIRRNAWVNTDEETLEYKIKNDKLIERIKSKNIKTVNLVGLDGNGKKYLCSLFKQGKNVIPTIDNLLDINKLGLTEKYILKDKNSFGSGIGQKTVSADEIEREFQEGYIIQPQLKFKSEVQCYFVGEKLMYVYEYSPSKYPNYPDPKEISLNEKERKLVDEFVKIANVRVGFLRLDFLRLLNDELILLEIEDNSPHMDLEKLNEDIREQVISEYKNNIYKCLQD